MYGVVMVFKVWHWEVWEHRETLRWPKTPSLTPLYDQEYFHMFIELDHDHKLLTVTTEQFILNREYMEIEFSLTVDKVCFMDNKKKHYVYIGSLKDSQDLWHKCQALWHQSRKCHCSPLSQTSGHTGNQEQTDGHLLSTKSSSVWWKTVPPSIRLPLPLGLPTCFLLARWVPRPAELNSYGCCALDSGHVVCLITVITWNG